MIDPTSPKGRVMAAALRLAEAKPWCSVTLLDIGESADVSLAELRKLFASKTAILVGFMRSIDDEVLLKVPKRRDDQAPRDRLFEVIMSRFDALAPHKAALRSIRRSGTADPMLLCSLLASQHWMLQAAGISTDGLNGSFKVGGLTSLYGSVFRIWLDDTDAGLAKTMATLDRRLRRGERTLQTINEVCGSVGRLGSVMSTIFGRRHNGDAENKTQSGIL
jgi:AcrR family transcriptional regulator